MRLLPAPLTRLDSPSQADIRIIRLRNHLILTRELDDRRQGTKRLFLQTGGADRDVGEHGRFEKVAADVGSTGEEFGAECGGVGNVVLDLIQGAGVDERAVGARCAE